MDINKLLLVDRLDAEERELILQIQTYEACTMSVLKMASNQEAPLHRLAVEDIVSCLHRMNMDLQTELLHVRLKRALDSII